MPSCAVCSTNSMASERGAWSTRVLVTQSPRCPTTTTTLCTGSSASASRTWRIMGRPHSRCRGLGRDERILVPSPAASTTAESGLVSMRFSLSPDDGGDSALHDDLEAPPTRRRARPPPPDAPPDLDDRPRLRRLPPEPGGHGVGPGRGRRAAGGGPGRRGRALRGAPPEPGEDARPRAGRAPPRPRLPLPRDRPPGGVGDRLHGGGEPGLGHRRGERGRVPGVGQRPHGAGRRHQSLHHAQVVTPGRHRPREPAAVDQPGRVGRGRPSHPVRDLHPRGARLSRPHPALGRGASPPSRSCSGTPPRAAPTCRA